MHHPTEPYDPPNQAGSSGVAQVPWTLSRPSHPFVKPVIILLATLLVANPVILFLLTRSVLFGSVVPLICVAIMGAVASRPRLNLLSAYLFNAMAVLSVFAHAEVILVYGFPDYVVENLYTIEDGYYFNRPFLDQIFSTKEYAVHYRTNSQGFRIAAEQDAAQTYSTADWLVIGDSFTQGAQVDYSQLYTTVLNQRFPDKIVVNAGISGLGIGHEYNYFTKAGYRLAPDVVILQLCSFNDFMNVEPNLVGWSDRLMTYSAFIRLLLADFKFTNPAALPLGRWTEPFHPDRQSNADFNIFYKETSSTKQRDLQAFERYLVRLRDAVHSRGARLLVVVIPTKEQVHPHYLEEVMREFAIDSAQLDMRRPNALVGDLTRRLNIEFIDLLPAFQQKANEKPFFDYDEHLSPLGHTLMANAIGERLEQLAGPSQVRVLSTDLGADRYPMLSQDGAVLSYQSFRDGNMELFLATPDLRERRRLTFNDVDESHPTLSKDNSQILFTEGSPESQRTKVMIMNRDGSGRRALTSEPNVFGAIPAFSRSNRQVAYTEWTYDEPSNTFSTPRIVVLDVLSGGKQYVTAAGRETWRPVFAPDEAHVYYIAKTQGQFDVYAYDLHEKAERRLTQTQFDEWDPQLSPDGSRLVYAARVDGNWDLFLVELASGVTQRLTKTKGDEWDPSFAPDGASLLFAGRFGLRESIFTMSLPH